MRKQSVFLFAFFAFSSIVTFSCKKIDQILTFTISDKSDFTIPASSSAGLPFSIPTPAVTSNSSEAFANNNTDANHVKNIYLEELSLNITSPSGQTFDFVKSIHIYISTKSAAEIELAGIDNVPSNVQTITLTPTQSALDAYLKSESYTLRTEVVTQALVSQDVSVEADSRFKVTAKL